MESLDIIHKTSLLNNDKRLIIKELIFDELPEKYIELTKVKELHIVDTTIKSVVNFPPNIEKLILSGNNCLIRIDISLLPKNITVLRLQKSHNYIVSNLDFSPLPNLNKIIIDNIKFIKQIKFNFGSVVKELSINETNIHMLENTPASLTKINAKNNSELVCVDLNCSTNITKAVFDDCSSLKNIFIGELNILERLDIDDCTSLEQLYINSPKLETFWCRNCNKLDELTIIGGSTDKIFDIATNGDELINLKKLHIENLNASRYTSDSVLSNINKMITKKNIEHIILKNCQNISNLFLMPNFNLKTFQIENIDVPNIDSIIKTSRNLVSCTIHKCDSIINQDISNSMLKTLDIQSCEHIRKINISSSSLTNITVKNNTRISSFNIDNWSTLENIDISHIKNIPTITASKMKSIILNNCRNIDSIDVSHSQIEKFHLIDTYCGHIKLDYCTCLTDVIIHKPDNHGVPILEMDESYNIITISLKNIKTKLEDIFYGKNKLENLSLANITNPLELPTNKIFINSIKNLKSLSIDNTYDCIVIANCDKLQDISITNYLQFKGFKISNCGSLSELTMKNINGEFEFDYSIINSLKKLTIHKCDFITDICLKDNIVMEELSICNNHNIQEIVLDNMTVLSSLNISNLSALMDFTIKDCKKISELVLSDIPTFFDADISKMPLEIYKISNIDILRNIKFIDNQTIKTISITKCSKIKTLKIYDCHNLEQLEILDLDNITHFDIKNNLLLETITTNEMITAMIPKLKSIESLKKLILRDIISETIHFDGFENIEYIKIISSDVLKDIKITNCDDINILKFISLTNLTNLEISNINNLKNVIINKCPHIDSLTLVDKTTNSSVSYKGDSIQYITKLVLKDYDVKKNIVNSSILTDIFSNLTYLYLENTLNKTIDLSDTNGLVEIILKDCDSLVSFDFSKNKTIDNISIIDCLEIEDIDVSGSENLKTLEIIDCPILEKLDISETLISNIDTYPDTIETLNISNCNFDDQKISILPSSLVKFVAINTNIKYLPEFMPEKCKVIKIAKCQLEKIGLSKCDELKNIIIAETNIDTIDNIPDSVELLVINKCQLKNATIEKLPKSLVRISAIETNVKHLNFESFPHTCSMIDFENSPIENFPLPGQPQKIDITGTNLTKEEKIKFCDTIKNVIGLLKTIGASLPSIDLSFNDKGEEVGRSRARRELIGGDSISMAEHEFMGMSGHGDIHQSMMRGMSEDEREKMKKRREVVREDRFMPTSSRRTRIRHTEQVIC
jgi:hypothetical protein